MAIEVKSDLRKQWKEVMKAAKRIGELRRDESALRSRTIEKMSVSAAPLLTSGARIPFLAVGYRGWSDSEALRAHMAKSDEIVDAVLIIDSEQFVMHPDGQLAGIPKANGPFSFWAFISVVHDAARQVVDTGVRLSDYLTPDSPRIPTFAEIQRMDKEPDRR